MTSPGKVTPIATPMAILKMSLFPIAPCLPSECSGGDPAEYSEHNDAGLTGAPDDSDDQPGNGQCRVSESQTGTSPVKSVSHARPLADVWDVAPHGFVG